MANYGVLTKGIHLPGSGDACALEAWSEYIGVPRTDDPVTLRTWDIRPFDEMPWMTNEARTGALVELTAAMAGSRDWTSARILRFLELVQTRIRKEVFPILDIRPKMADAYARFHADAYGSDHADARAMSSALGYTRAVADIRTRDHRPSDTLLVLLCRIWAEAAVNSARSPDESGVGKCL